MENPTEQGVHGLLGRLAASKVSRHDLQKAAQLAIDVEFSTIPVYLTGLYSITDTSSNAYQQLRSVVMEEMFHVNQAANLLVSLGGTPRFTGKHVPTYPTYLPHANPRTTPYIGLYQASADVFNNVYAAIETPAAAGAPPQGDNYDSIAQLYDAVVQAIGTFEKEHPKEDLFVDDGKHGRQRTDIYLGKFGGTVLRVTDNKTALAAVDQIVRQGEGKVHAAQPMQPEEPYGAYQHYGMRTDGTYGPILGTPTELSHFAKFRQVYLDAGSFPATSPISSNPLPETYTNAAAKHLSRLFDLHYSLLLDALEATFAPHSDADNPYFGAAMILMHQALPILAVTLMQTPSHDNGDPTVGPNATPAWRYVPKDKRKDLRKEVDEAIKLVTGMQVKLTENHRTMLVSLLERLKTSLDRLEGQSPKLGL